MFSYKSIYDYPNIAPGVGGELHKFRSVARTGFNALDVPDARFFKLLFYFQDKNSTNNDQLIMRDHNNNEMITFDNGGSGLLACDWPNENQITPSSYPFYTSNSAYSYLMNNLEVERAEELRQFISLLSNISSESPWYFKEIAGVDEALGRENYKVEEERKKITITCMEDPLDHRISSLLSAYRSIVWSHARKCEVLPANLRKFDMGLFVFSGLTMGPHATPYKKSRLENVGVKLAGDAFDESGWKNVDVVGHEINEGIRLKSNFINTSSCKFIEFHNCEISMDSIKSGYGTMTNESGFQQEFKIDIYFDDCYEMEYNQFLLRTFGDLLLSDVGLVVSYGDNTKNENGVIKPELNVNKDTYYDGSGLGDNNIDTMLEHLINPYAYTQDWVDENGLGQVVGAAAQTATNIAMKAGTVVGLGLGNLYNKGIIGNADDNINKQVNSITNKVLGNVSDYTTKIINTVQNAVENPIKKATNSLMSYTESDVDAVDRAVRRIGESTKRDEMKSLGNMYKA